MAVDKKAKMKDGTRRRPRATKGARGGGLPPVMWVAIVVCAVGAVFLFRTQSADVPTGIGENQTVVTAAENESTLAQDESARSGDVDISAERQDLTPEKSEESAEKPAETKTEPVKTVAAKTPQKTTPKTTAEAPARILPLEVGPYVVQVGSFGEAPNADKEAERLMAAGWDARVKLGNTSSGDFIYRVRIGYFQSRAEAETFIRENRKKLQGAIAVHR
ncbi:MAG: cell division protein FtsN [Candidatus Krumholzibacteriia bacterium]|jgi:cell division protein FtsN